MTSSVPVLWKRTSTRYVAPAYGTPRIQCFQEEGPEGAGSDEGEDEDEDEDNLEDDGPLPSLDDLDGA